MAPSQQIVLQFDERLMLFFQAAANLHGLSLQDFAMMSMIGVTRRSLSGSKEASISFMAASENERIRLAAMPLRSLQQ